MTFITSALAGLFLLPGVTVLQASAPTAAPAAVAVAHTHAASADFTPSPDTALAVKMTSYNAVPAQTDGSPFITASGAYANSEVVAARSRDLAKELPFGTVIAVESPATPSNTCGYGVVALQIGYRVIADTMAASKHDQIDILLNQKNTVRVGKRILNPSLALGLCKGVTIRVVGHVNVNHMPKTQAALAQLVAGTTLALR